VKKYRQTHIDTAYEKYRRYLGQFSTSIADTIRPTNTAILTTAIEAEKRWKEKEVGKRIEVGCLLERMFWVGLISCRR